MTEENAIDIIYDVLQYSIVPFWALLVFFPAWKVTSVMIRTKYVPFFYSVVYAFFMLMSQIRSVGTPSCEDCGDASTDRLISSLTNKYTLTGAWVHYLCFDFFLGCWEVRDARIKGIPHVVVIGCLLLTLFLGPVGFLVYWIVRVLSTRSYEEELEHSDHKYTKNRWIFTCKPKHEVIRFIMIWFGTKSFWVELFNIKKCVKTCGFLEKQKREEKNEGKEKKEEPKLFFYENEEKGKKNFVEFDDHISIFLEEVSPIPLKKCEVRIDRTSFSVTLPVVKKQKRRRIIEIDYSRIVSARMSPSRSKSVLVTFVSSEMDKVFEIEIFEDPPRTPTTQEAVEDSKKDVDVCCPDSEKIFQMIYYYSFMKMNKKERKGRSPKSLYQSLPITLPPTPERNILFICNPVSGGGTSLEIFYKEIYPHIPKIQGLKKFQVLLTRHKGHAFTYASHFDFSKEEEEINEICVCGGDGTFKEVVDGFLHNIHEKDFRRIFTSLLRFSVIPFGSGNGLALEILQNSENIFKAFLTLSRGRFAGLDVAVLFRNRPIDIIRNYTLPETDKNSSQPVVNSHFEVCCTFANLGTTANVNHQTEKWRWMGPKIKFVLASLWVVIQNSSYDMDVKFVVPDGGDDNPEYKRTEDPSFKWKNIFDDDEENEEEKEGVEIPFIIKHFSDEFFGSILNSQNEDEIRSRFLHENKEEISSEESYDEEEEGESDIMTEEEIDDGEEEERDEDQPLKKIEDEEEEGENLFEGGEEILDLEEEEEEDRKYRVEEWKNEDVFHFTNSNFKKGTKKLWNSIYSHPSDGLFDIQCMPPIGRVSTMLTLNKIFVDEKKQRFDQVKVHKSHKIACLDCTSKKKNQEKVMKHFRCSAFLYKPNCEYVRCSVDGEIRVIEKGNVVIGEVLRGLVNIAMDEEKDY